LVLQNPLIALCSDPAVDLPLAELKQHLLLFVESPPGPKTARAVYELYFRTFGDRFRSYASTSAGRLLRPWSPGARRDFESHELTNLRQHEDWGYVFADDQKVDSWLFMFHGYRPFSEAGKASFYRFEFDWQVPSARLLEFALQVLKRIQC